MINISEHLKREITMYTKTKREIKKRMNQMPSLTPEQREALVEKIKKHREKYPAGYLDHRGIFWQPLKDL